MPSMQCASVPITPIIPVSITNRGSTKRKQRNQARHQLLDMMFLDEAFKRDYLCSQSSLSSKMSSKKKKKKEKEKEKKTPMVQCTSYTRIDQ